MSTETAGASRGVRSTLARYAATAGAVRVADAGASVALLLLAVQRLAPADAAHVGGTLVAVYTIPHVVGPVLARRLDLARDVRPLLAAAFVGYAVLLGAAGMLLTPGSVVVVAVLVGLAGLGGPLLTGGLSSRLADLVPGDERAQRRAQGLDAATYGLAGTAGPALVAGVAAGVSAFAALLVLAGLAVAAAALVMTLPALPRPVPVGEVPPLRTALRAVVVNGPLRRVNYATMVTAAAQAGLAVVAVQLAAPYAVAPSTSAALLAVLGAGSLVGSLLLTLRPLRGEPDRSTTTWGALIGLCFGVCALAPTFAWAVGAFALMGVLTALFVTATFAARTTYAPPAARAQVFVTLVAMKLTAASAGTGLAGLLAGVGPRPLLWGMGALVLGAAAATVLDRRVERATWP